MPDSNLDFDGYTQFRHPKNVPCKTYSIKDSYKKFAELSKIDALEIAEDDETYVDDDESQLHYTCLAKDCRIPCSCAPCCTGESQCADHRIKHEEMFDENLDAVSIRNTEEYCLDGSFFKKGYLIKYPGIPITCKKCKKDFLHHLSYHLDFHEHCKFCRKNRFKTYAETPTQFQSAVKKQSEFLKSVCPHCDNKFCEPHFRKKHVEFEHGNAPFSCDYCSTKFHSKQSKEYHEAVHYLPAGPKEACPICEKEFSATVSLRNHVKYVHSEVREHSCVVCEKTFKQKKEMRTHMLHVHGFNMSKAMHGNFEGQDEFKCKFCDSSYRYKKNLNAHIRFKHEQATENEDEKNFQCDECASRYQEKRSLDEHKRLKHSDEKPEFACQVCGKVFNQKNNRNRHMKIHKKD